MGKPSYLTVRLDPADLSELRRLAQAKGFNLSEMARKCLRAGLRLAPDFPAKSTDHEIAAAPRKAA